jgi:tRNA dimethylallyltransferase
MTKNSSVASWWLAERNRANIKRAISEGFRTRKGGFQAALFFIVGPTATGKSEIAAEIAQVCGAEVVSADAFQIYRGLDLLTAKPDPVTMMKAPHHLIGEIPLDDEMTAARFRDLAQVALGEIGARGRPAIVVGGSGLYLKTLTDGLAETPAPNRELRAKLNRAPPDQLYAQLQEHDPQIADRIDRRNKRRLVRALEICLLSGKPFPTARTQWKEASTMSATPGVFAFRDRDELYQRINRRVEAMFARGVIEEVRALDKVGSTAEKTLGLREIRQLIAHEITEAECITRIQQATRRYAKRQLTWFRHQTNFLPLNLSLQSPSEAIEWILRKARLSFAHRDD